MIWLLENSLPKKLLVTSNIFKFSNLDPHFYHHCFKETPQFSATRQRLYCVLFPFWNVHFSVMSDRKKTHSNNSVASFDFSTRPSAKRGNSWAQRTFPTMLENFLLLREACWLHYFDKLFILNWIIMDFLPKSSFFPACVPGGCCLRKVVSFPKLRWRTNEAKRKAQFPASRCLAPGRKQQDDTSRRRMKNSINDWGERKLCCLLWSRENSRNFWWWIFREISTISYHLLSLLWNSFWRESNKQIQNYLERTLLLCSHEWQLRRVASKHVLVQDLRFLSFSRRQFLSH